MTSLLSPSHFSALSADAPRVKVVVLGETGVGKTSFVQSVKGQAVKNPQWTIGCSVELIVHSYRAGTPKESVQFIELWDVGGSRSHQNSRKVFYQPIHGLILVHDLTNKKSQENLRFWLSEVFDSKNSRSSMPLPETPLGCRLPTTIFDGEQFSGERDVPILVVGTKADQIPHTQYSQAGSTRSSPPKGFTKVSVDCGADEIALNSRLPISPGSTNGLKVAKFFDKVIDCQNKTEKRTYSSSGPTLLYDRKRKGD